ncbi:MAG: hypothetical protein LBC80_02905 [Treponema sp.]|jgi:polygalacturonase|nr:hypothetical protein [Treponema sp.]
MRKLTIIFAAIFVFSIFGGCATAGPSTPTDGRFNVMDFGARGNGATNDTRAIQRAVDAAGAYGDPEVEVYFPAGTYITTSIILRSNVTIHIPEGAILQASRTPSHWPNFTNATNVEEQINAPRFSVFYGQSLENITFKGKGIIDGAGGFNSPYYTQPNDPSGRPSGEFMHGRRPQTIIYIRDTENLKFNDLTLRNSVRWTFVIELCNNVHVDGIIIRNPPHDVGREVDGICINTSSNVLIENFDIITGDDAIVIKPQRDYFRRPPNNTPRNQHNVHVRNGEVATTTNAVKIGTGTQVNLDGLLVENIVVRRHPGPSHPDEDGRTIPRNATTAISVQSNDGGHISNLVYRNFTVYDIDTPIFIGLQQRLRPTSYTHDMGSVSNVHFENIVVHRSDRASQINSQDGTVITNVTFKDISVRNYEQWTGTTRPPRMIGTYPDADRYGSMPAFGLFARNVDGLHFEGTNAFVDAANTGRPMYAFENIVNINGIPAALMPEQIDTTDHPRFPDRPPVFVETFDERDMHDREGSTRWPRDINRAPVGAWAISNFKGERVIEKGETPSNRFLILNYPGASEWENKHIHIRVWPGRRDHRIPANTQIGYRVVDRHERMAIALARSNRGWVRINQFDPYIRADGEKDSNQTQQFQVGLLSVANNIMDREMEFIDIDIVVDGPFISIYADGEEVIRDYYDISWENPARRKGTINIGGTPLMRFSAIRVTLIENSTLVTSSANVSRANITDFPITVNLNGNAIINVRHAGRRLQRDTDFTVNGNIVTLNRSFLQTLPAGRQEFTINMNLGNRDLPFVLNIQ